MGSELSRGEETKDEAEDMISGESSFFRFLGDNCGCVAKREEKCHGKSDGNQAPVRAHLASWQAEQVSVTPLEAVPNGFVKSSSDNAQASTQASSPSAMMIDHSTSSNSRRGLKKTLPRSGSLSDLIESSSRGPLPRRKSETSLANNRPRRGSLADKQSNPVGSFKREVAERMDDAYLRAQAYRVMALHAGQREHQIDKSQSDQTAVVLCKSTMSTKSAFMQSKVFSGSLSAMHTAGELESMRRRRGSVNEVGYIKASTELTDAILSEFKSRQRRGVVGPS